MPFLNVRLVGDVRVVEFTLTDMTDGVFIKKVGDEIYELIQKLEHPRIVIDFGKVERLSSATLGMMVALKKVIVDKQGGELRVCNIAKHLQEIFKMTRLTRVMKICDTADDAVASMGLS